MKDDLQLPSCVRRGRRETAGAVGVDSRIASVRAMGDPEDDEEEEEEEKEEEENEEEEQNDGEEVEVPWKVAESGDR